LAQAILAQVSSRALILPARTPTPITQHRPSGGSLLPIAPVTTPFAMAARFSGLSRHVSEAKLSQQVETTPKRLGASTTGDARGAGSGRLLGSPSSSSQAAEDSLVLPPQALFADDLPGDSLGNSADSLFRELSAVVDDFLYAGDLGSPKKVVLSPRRVELSCHLALSDTPPMAQSPEGLMPASLNASVPKARGQPLAEVNLPDPQQVPSPPWVASPQKEDLQKVSTSPAKRLAQALEAEGVTTLMLRNIPITASQATLLEELNRCGFGGLFDFCYLPCEFGTRENKGYAFINLVSTDVLEKFVLVWHGCRRLGVLPTGHALNVSAAAVQGLEKNIKKWGARIGRVRNSELRPYIALQDGSQCLPQDKFSSPERNSGQCHDPFDLPTPAGVRPPPGLPPPPHLQRHTTLSPAMPQRPQRAGLPIGADPRGAGSTRHTRLR